MAVYDFAPIPLKRTESRLGKHDAAALADRHWEVEDLKRLLFNPACNAADEWPELSRPGFDVIENNQYLACRNSGTQWQMAHNFTY